MDLQGRFRYRRLSRQILDNRLLGLGPIRRYAPPEGGWVRAVRESLEMSATELARLMGVTEGAVRSIERNEVSGSVQLESLQRAAAAMDCTAVIAFIPNHSLEYTARLRRVARGRPEVRPGDLLEKLMPKINIGPHRIDPDYWHSPHDWLDQ